MKTTLSWLRASLGALMLALAACGGGGGGGGTAGVGTGGTGYASGPVSGFASVIVNGVDFDDRSASITDDDGQPFTRDALRLGMTVDVNSGAITTNSAGLQVATAQRIQVLTLAVGLVDSVDVAGNALVVLGQRIAIDAATAFDASFTNRLSSLTVGQPVQVHGLLGADGSYRATRIAPVTSPANYRLRGVVGAVNTGAATLTVGGTTFGVASVSLLNGVTVGSRMQLKLATTQDGASRWVVSSLNGVQASVADGTEVKVEGLIDRFTDRTHFSVGGITIDASGAAFDPTTATLQLGSRVEVEGPSTGGVVRATKVKLDDTGDASEIRVSGALSALDTTLKRFVVRETVVDYSATDLRIDNGTLADLANGRSVEVRGALSTDGTRLVATRLKFL